VRVAGKSLTLWEQRVIEGGLEQGWPDGRDSTHQKGSYRPVPPPHSRSGLGHELQDLLCRGRMRRSAATYGAAGTLELFAERGPMNA
jgi:hypothetical protein